MKDNNISGEVRVMFPEEEKYTVKTGNALAITLFAFLLFLCIFGSVVEYTDLFGRPLISDSEEINDEERDKRIVASKSPLGKAFLSFSISRNFKKIF